MNFGTAFKYSVLFAVVLLNIATVKAVQVPDEELKEVEQKAVKLIDDSGESELKEL